MSLFQCEHCGCCENTALSSQGFVNGMERFYDWSYAPERKGLRLCSACGPTSFACGKLTEYGKWHGRFPRTFLPMGVFHTNGVGNLAHNETGSENFREFEIAGKDGNRAASSAELKEQARDLIHTSGSVTDWLAAMPLAQAEEAIAIFTRLLDDEEDRGRYQPSEQEQARVASMRADNDRHQAEIAKARARLGIK